MKSVFYRFQQRKRMKKRSWPSPQNDKKRFKNVWNNFPKPPRLSPGLLGSPWGAFLPDKYQIEEHEKKRLKNVWKMLENASN